MSPVSRVFSQRWAPIVCACAMLAVPLAARAGWPSDPTVNVPLCTTAFSSEIGATLSDQRGGAIAVWYEDRAGDFDVFARRVDSAGAPQWTANGVKLCVTTAGTSQILPKAVSDGAGGAIVVWMDNRNGPIQLFAQRVDSSGVLRWGAAGLLLASGNSNVVAEFNLVADGSGGVVVAWATPVDGVSSNIFSQRVNSLGALQWGSNAKALCTNAAEQVRPRIVRKASGTIVVAWEDARAGFSTFVYGQAINTAGTALWAANGLLLAGSADNAINPMLLATGADDCLLFWDADSLGVGDIRAQRLGTAGAPQWAGAGLHMFPKGVSGLLAVNTDQVGGGYLVAASLDATTQKSPLWAQRVQGNGALLYPAIGTRVSSIASNQFQVALASDDAGGLILAWYDDQRSLPTSVDIFAQRMSPFGDALWYPTGVPVCRAPNQQGNGLCIAQSGGGAVVAWSDTRTNLSPDIYAQGVDALGRLGSNLPVGVDPTTTPAATALARPAPNPAPHGSTRITYTLSAPEHVQLRVVDPSGRVMGVLEDGLREPGMHSVAWDGRSNGRQLPPGLYLVQLLTPSRSEIRRLVVL